MKQTAEDYLGEKVTEAVITVLAYFNDSQRQVTMTPAVSPAQRAPHHQRAHRGLARIRPDKKKDEKIAVFDLGGGTFDVSIPRPGDGVFEVKATNGDTFLGGEDSDQRVIDYPPMSSARPGYRPAHGSAALQRLKEAAEKAKMKLSTVMETDINLPFITADQSGPKHLTSLTRAARRLCGDPLTGLSSSCPPR
jgi:molecular chaperone DnaK